MVERWSFSQPKRRNNCIHWSYGYVLYSSILLESLADGWDNYLSLLLKFGWIWAQEAHRLFCDRLVEKSEKDWYEEVIYNVARSRFAGVDYDNVLT